MGSSNTVTMGHGAGLWGHRTPDSLSGCALPHTALGLFSGLGEWQETSLCYSQPCFHRLTLVQASRQTVSLLERFKEQKCVFDKRHHVLCGSGMFNNIFPALSFLPLFDRHVCLGIVHPLYPFLLIFISSSGTMYTYRIKLFHSPMGQWLNDSNTSGSFQWPKAQYYDHFSGLVSGGKICVRVEVVSHPLGGSRQRPTHPRPVEGSPPCTCFSATCSSLSKWAPCLGQEALQTLSVVLRLLWSLE